MELNNFWKLLKEQEKKYGVEIIFSPDVIRDEKHLDCLWYGGEVGCIKYNGYDIVIGAHGDIRLNGKINGQEVDFKDKNNSGSAFYELGDQMDDELLYKLLESEDKDNFLIFENNNWFEVDLIGPDGRWIDLCDMDNVLDNNILDCFTDVSDYFSFVDMEIAERLKMNKVGLDALLNNAEKKIQDQSASVQFTQPEMTKNKNPERF